MAFRFDDPMTLLAASFAGLNGSVVVCGMSTRNLDATRDRCALHLHTRTGGLVVTRDEECTYLPPGALSNVELAPEEGRVKDVGSGSGAQAGAGVPASKAEAVDEFIEALMREDARVRKEQPEPSTRRRRVKPTP